MYRSYGELCTEVYDLSKPLGYSYGDVEYYIERLSDIRGNVLEIGCGSGRVLIPLLQAGISIDGLDHSDAMLDSCRKRCKQLDLSPVLIKAEMHDFALKCQYDAVIIPAGSFQLIEGRELANLTLERIYSSLLPGGRLIMDLFIPTDLTLSLPITKTWTTANNEVIVLEDKRIELNVLEQKIVSLLKYEKWHNGNLINSELQRLPLSWYGCYEFEMLLEKNGFQETTVSADYQYLNKPTVAGQMITFEAIKAK